MPPFDAQPEPVPAAPRGRFDWLPIHPALAFTLAGAFVIILLVLGVFLFERPLSSSDGTLQAWGGGPQSAQDSTSYGAAQTAPSQTSTAPSGSNASPIYIPPNQNGGSVPTDSGQTFDMAAFLNELSQPPAKISGSASTTVSAEAYSYIPRGLISTSTLIAKRTPLQESLFQYGNDAGDYIQSYEDTHCAIPQTLTDEIADRYNDQKVQAVKEIGAALIEVGQNLQGMSDVPSIAVKANANLASSYIEIGTKLQAVADAKTDQALLSAVQTYNTAADTFAGRYITLAQLLSGAGVIFAPGDSGSVFTFTNAQQL